MPSRKVDTKFYTYSQNNSGGSFIHDATRGIGEYVIIEATSPEDANRRAESIGLYFYGCDTGDDCSCCGDRWYSMSSDDKGDDVPSIYGQDVSGGQHFLPYGRSIPSYIHYFDGSITEVKEVHTKAATE